MSIKLTSLILPLLEELRASLCGLMGHTSCRSVLISTTAATPSRATLLPSTSYLITIRLIILERQLSVSCLRSEFWGIGTHQIECLLEPRLIRTQVSASSPSTLASATPLGLLV